MSDIYQFLSPDGLTVIREVTVESTGEEELLEQIRSLRQRIVNHRPRKVVDSKVIEPKQIEGSVNGI